MQVIDFQIIGVLKKEGVLKDFLRQKLVYLEHIVKEVDLSFNHLKPLI